MPLEEKPKDLLSIVTETIVGRTKEDYEKFGNIATGYIGKHIVGTGEDAHLTTKVFIDLLKPHVILVSGKRGSGKSYSAAVILEEFLLLPEEFRQKMAFVVFDPVGIYWSMKFPNEAQLQLLNSWQLEPKGFDNIKVYVPEKQLVEYEKAEIPVDGTISISLSDLTAEDLILAFNLERTNELAVTLEKNFNSLLESKKVFGLDDLIDSITSDTKAKKETKDALTSLLSVLSQWGIIKKEGTKVNELIKPGEVVVFDFSRLKSQEVRTLVAGLITREVLHQRILSRKEEEIAKITGEQLKIKFPITWLIFEEAHNFVPSDRDVSSSADIKRVAKEGREPGVGLIVITQMPSKIHQDILSQTDLVISFRLTSKDDLQALHSVMQTYVQEELEKYLNRLPRIPGSAILLDDNLEKIFTVNIRPRISHHAGGTARVV
ncbi:MAG: ATP-binding protein [Candidatus Aenigmatarchaeota archaeon]|nr:ATP-binding protein [Candidatus Aenigmarchaeota archaeon]